MLQRSKSLLAAALFGAVAFAAGNARADEVQFKNGDKLTGTIVSADKETLKLKSKMAGEVTIKMEDVKTFSTDAPVKVKMNDGSVAQQQVGASKDGQVAVQPAGAAAAATAVPITSIKSINQNDDWTGSLVAGGLITRGNSETDAFNIGFNVARRTDNDRILIDGQYLYGKQRNPDTGDKTVTTDNWRLNGKYDYFLSKQLYAFGSAGIEKDRIAELNMRFTPAAGLGYQWVERKDFNVWTEAGLAWVYQDYESGTDQFAAIKIAYHIDKQLNEAIKVFHNTTYFQAVDSFEDYLILTDAGLQAKLTDKLFAEFKVELRYDSNPAAGSSRSDLRYILGVGWNF